MKVLRTLKLASVLTSLNNRSLSEDEIRQHVLLKKRNTFNICCINEAAAVLKNAKTVGEDGNISCPALLFSSNGKDQERDWVENQQKFAATMGARLISYDCGHYIHHFKSDAMSKEIIPDGTQLVQIASARGRYGTVIRQQEATNGYHPGRKRTLSDGRI